MEADDEESNLALITRALEELGYLVRVFRVVAKDFGLPQRRVRIYIAGFHKDFHESVSWTRMEKMLYAMRLKCQLPETSLQ